MILRIVAAAGAAFMLAGAAVADEPQLYEQLGYANAIDENCGFMPYVEHVVLADLAWQALSESPAYKTAHDNNDSTFEPKFNAQQMTRAKALGCTDPVAAGTVQAYRGAIIAALGVAVAETNLRSQQESSDPWGLDDFGPTAQDVTDARRLDGYIHGLLSADDYQKLGPYATQQAQKNITDDPTGISTRWSTYIYNVDYEARAEQDKALLVAGPSPWQRYRMQDGKIAFTQRIGVITDNYDAFIYFAVRDGQVYAGALAKDGGPVDGLTGLRIYLRKAGGPLKPGETAKFWDDHWRSLATAYDLTPSPLIMFGAKMYQVPKAALDAMKGLGDDSGELTIVRGSDDNADAYSTARAEFNTQAVVTALALQ